MLFAYHSYAHDVRGLIYDRPNHDNFNVHGYEEEGSTTTPYDMVRGTTSTATSSLPKLCA